MIRTDVCYKVAYDTLEAAQSHVTWLANLHGIEPDVYECADCHWLHVGYTAEQRVHLIRTSYPRLGKQREFDENGRRVGRH